MDTFHRKKMQFHWLLEWLSVVAMVAAYDVIYDLGGVAKLYKKPNLQKTQS